MIKVLGVILISVFWIGASSYAGEADLRSSARSGAVQSQGAYAPDPGLALILGSAAGFGSGQAYATGGWNSRSTWFAVVDGAAGLALAGLVLGSATPGGWGTVSQVGLFVWPFALVIERIIQGKDAQKLALSRTSGTPASVPGAAVPSLPPRAGVGFQLLVLRF